MDDRRKFLRFDLPIDVEAKSTNIAGDYAIGVCNDFSREGMSLVSGDFNFDPNTSLELKLQLPTQEKYITASGDVVWKKKIDDKWRAGLKITNIDKANKGDLLDYAYDKWLAKMRSNR
jgi:c-di-GMP-binding flagellar brake protein YcgR